MLVKISCNPSRSLVYGYSSWAKAGDLHGLHRGSYNLTIPCMEDEFLNVTSHLNKL